MGSLQKFMSNHLKSALIESRAVLWSFSWLKTNNFKISNSVRLCLFTVSFYKLSNGYYFCATSIAILVFELLFGISVNTMIITF